MIKNFEDIKKISDENTEKLAKSTSFVTKGVQDIAAATAEFSKDSIAKTTAAVQELTAVKSLDKALELQLKLGKEAYEAAVAHSTKINELSMNLFKDAFKPFGDMFAGVAANAPVAKSNKAA